MRLGVLWAVFALAFMGVVAAILVVIADPALAQLRPVPSTRPGPAPLIGVGLPLVVGGVLAAIMLVRRFRRKN